ncbi:pirin family protein [Vibrio hannami]|uniref:pirin family protein n=1 Tax=Vibrio hannami TaxID=2717094 RepID=UPI002410B37C|nr:pirin family protein [Vibrio hannami]MDG3085077.1 pirin family protein [Vibrio hannami]
MITVRYAQDRGQANYGWLDTKYSFSFADYYDPAHMGFSSLRVINDDLIYPGAGFDTHGHRDMEIITYITDGSIEHKDSEGNVRVLPAGEFQLMSAGKGIYHSEYNASQVDKLALLQIWIEPNEFGGTPGYQQKDFGHDQGITTIATPTGENGTLQIKQDAKLHQLILEPGSTIDFDIELGRNVYVHQVTGTLLVDATSLSPGDGAKVENQDSLELKNSGDDTVTALIFDLP